jgi:hypothetical protein
VVVEGLDQREKMHASACDTYYGGQAVSWKDRLHAFGAVKDKRGNRIVLSLGTLEVRERA